MFSAMLTKFQKFQQKANTVGEEKQGLEIVKVTQKKKRKEEKEKKQRKTLKRGF